MLLAAAMGLMCWEARTAPGNWHALAATCPGAIFARLTLGFLREVEDEIEYHDDLQIIAEIGPRAVPYLKWLTDSERPGFAELGYYGLGVLSRSEAMAPADRTGLVAWLVPRLSSPDPEVRRQACGIASCYRAEAAPLVPHLRAMLLDPDRKTLETALGAVERLGAPCRCYRPEVLLALSRAAFGEDFNYFCALDALTTVWPGHPGNNEALFTALAWRGPDAQFASAVVPRLDPHQLAPGELDWLEAQLTEREHDLWLRAAGKLVEAGRPGPAARAGVAIAARCPTDDLPADPFNRRLGERLRAIELVASAGRGAAGVLPELRELLREPDARVRGAAADAIRRAEETGGRTAGDL